MSWQAYGGCKGFLMGMPDCMMRHSGFNKKENE